MYICMCCWLICLKALLGQGHSSMHVQKQVCQDSISDRWWLHSTDRSVRESGLMVYCCTSWQASFTLYLPLGACCQTWSEWALQEGLASSLPHGVSH